MPAVDLVNFPAQLNHAVDRVHGTCRQFALCRSANEMEKAKKKLIKSLILIKINSSYRSRIA